MLTNAKTVSEVGYLLVDCASFGLLPEVPLLVIMLAPFWLLASGICGLYWCWRWGLLPRCMWLASRSNRSCRMVTHILWYVWWVIRSSVHNLLRLVLLGYSFCYLLLLLNSDMAHPYSMALVLIAEYAINFPGLIPKPSSEAPGASAPWSWRPRIALLLPRSLRGILWPLLLTSSVVILGGVDWSDVPWMDSPSEAPGHLGESVNFLPVGVLGPTAHPGLPLKVFLGVGRCRRL
jgi:hypothetical protein